MKGDPELGLALRRLRHRRRIQHTALADAIDVSPATLLAIEAGLIDPHWSRVRAAARALGVELDELGAAVEQVTA